MNLSVFVCRFYGKNSSYVHGGLDGSGKPVEPVYGQSVSHPADTLTSLDSAVSVLIKTHRGFTKGSSHLIGYR